MVYLFIFRTAQPINATYYDIFAGGRLLDGSASGALREVTNFTFAPNFLLSSRLNDIAIVTVSRKFRIPYAETFYLKMYKKIM